MHSTPRLGLILRAGISSRSVRLIGTLGGSARTTRVVAASQVNIAVRDTDAASIRKYARLFHSTNKLWRGIGIHNGLRNGTIHVDVHVRAAWSGSTATSADAHWVKRAFMVTARLFNAIVAVLEVGLGSRS